jgi:NadR type nicotinamide-nucleotide adenylyltransferase
MPIKIVIIGPESTGKSTLSKNLSAHFNDPWVEEYAREYVEKLDRPYEYEDLLLIAQGQLMKEEDQALKADRYLFCDTDLHVIQIWSRHRFGKTHPWILKQLKERRYDLYLITDIDIPWEADPQREHPDPEMRKYFMEKYVKIISNTEVPYIILRGDHKTRLKMAVDKITSLFNN